MLAGEQPLLYKQKRPYYGPFLLVFFFILWYNCRIIYGALAQLGAHNTGSVGVRGSSPLCSTRAADGRTISAVRFLLLCRNIFRHNPRKKDKLTDTRLWNMSEFALHNFFTKPLQSSRFSTYSRSYPHTACKTFKKQAQFLTFSHSYPHILVC